MVKKKFYILTNNFWYLNCKYFVNKIEHLIILDECSSALLPTYKIYKHSDILTN
jgi:hypothetical protein